MYAIACVCKLPETHSVADKQAEDAHLTAAVAAIAADQLLSAAMGSHCPLAAWYADTLPAL